MPKEARKSQSQFILEYFKARPNQVISHSISKKEIEESYYKLYKKRLEDCDRAIRKLHQQGLLIKEGKGQYKYDPEAVLLRGDLEDFTESTKRKILERDGYKCVVCGLGKDDGVALQVDHKLAKEFGGKATVENGQTLCAAHNFSKKTLGQLEFAKKIFIRLYEETSKDNIKESIVLNKFAYSVLKVFEEYHVDDHVIWHRTDNNPQVPDESNSSVSQSATRDSQEDSESSTTFKDLLDIASQWEDEIGSKQLIRVSKAIKFAELYKEGHSDSEIALAFDVSKGETGKLIAAGLAKLECGFDVLATLELIGKNSNQVTVGKIKAILNNLTLSKSQQTKALENLGLRS